MSSPERAGTSPFKHALNKSKSFLANLKNSKNKDHDDDDPTIGHLKYKRRMRVVTATELRDNPLNLGEQGWGAQSWSNLKREQRQKEELEELWDAMGNKNGGQSSAGTSPSRVSGPRTYSGQERSGRMEQERGSPGSSTRHNRRVSGSAETYNRPLPLRVSGPRDPPSPQSYRRRGSGTREPTAATGSSGLTPNGTRGRDSRTSAYPTTNNPLRTRVAGPRPSTHTRTSSYNSQGVRVTPGSYNDREREQYRSSSTARSAAMARSSVSAASAQSQDSPRAGDGTKRAVGGTLF